MTLTSTTIFVVAIIASAFVFIVALVVVPVLAARHGARAARAADAANASSGGPASIRDPAAASSRSRPRDEYTYTEQATGRRTSGGGMATDSGTATAYDTDSARHTRIRRHTRAAGREIPGLWLFLIQGTALVLLPLLVACTIFLGVNRSEQWFVNWPDIVAAGPVATRTHDFGAPAAAAERARVAHPAQTITPEQQDLRSNPVFGRQIAHADMKRARKLGLYVTGTIKGGQSHVDRPVGIWLPPQYFSNTRAVFPVVEAFSGVPGEPADYMRTAHIDGVVRRLTALKRITPPIIVIPQAYTSTYDSECVNATQGSGAQKMETWVAQDLPAWVKKYLRVRTEPQAWATMGYSAGGFCAAMLTTLHPAQFPHALVLSGYFAPIYADGQRWRPAGDKTYDLPAILHRTRPAVDIWVYAGDDDPYTTPSLKRLEPQIAAPTRLTTVIAQAGGHRWSTWMPGFTKGLERLGAVDSYFAPAPQKDGR